MNNKQEIVIYDDKQDILHVLGGYTLDDRAGVYAIIQIIEAGYKPHVIFTTDEEIGALGAQKLIEDFPECPF